MLTPPSGGLGLFSLLLPLGISLFAGQVGNMEGGTGAGGSYSGGHGGGHRCWGILHIEGGTDPGGGGGGGCLRLFEWYLQVFVVQSFQCRYSLLGVVGQEPV